MGGSCVRGPRGSSLIRPASRADGLGMPTSLFADLSPLEMTVALLVGLLGTGMLIYGKKAERPAILVAGLAMCLLPMLAHGVLAQLGLAAACVVGGVGLGRVFEGGAVA